MCLPKCSHRSVNVTSAVYLITYSLIIMLSPCFLRGESAPRPLILSYTIFHEQDTPFGRSLHVKAIIGSPPWWHTQAHTTFVLEFVY